ncbi:hypothetical protein GCM10025872_02870 [Barrientosiimonas endolithica]|uniref:AAA+ ATPase domain-containing protein n=1 Tax=Barrientosiimonas endolithica TaxID=1535208 RepID=A0ABN6YKW4_9MICO|nr:hypothetical protein GCM10025872_02870 [Barrientosiimonas endolithica]
MNAKRIARAPGFWIVLVVAIAFLWFALGGSGGFQRVDTSQAITLINENKVESAKVTPDRVDLTLKSAQDVGDVQDADKVQAYYVPARGEQIVTALNQRPPSQGFTDDPEQQNIFVSMLLTMLPLLLILGLFWFFMSQMQGGGGRVMQFGKSKAKLASKDMPKVTFADVAGSDEAVEELHEIKEFLSEPRKFLEVGAKIPKGVLLYGPPGTGKTLLARAVAGEAGVPFYTISGSDFVEMFVGVGASRVRDLFEQAKANAPAIIFVDEIDAVGRHRGAGLGGGHDEREQTLNQLLVEMDGFDVKTNVILIAATNRPDILDPALLRRAASTGRSRSRRPTWSAGTTSCRCTPRASRRLPTSTCSPSPDVRRASRVPTSPTCSTRPPCSPRAATAGSSTTGRSTRPSTASWPARRSAPG